MLSVNFNPFPVLETERLVLRRISQDDVNEMLFLRGDEGVMKYIDRPRFKTPEEVSQFIQKIIDMIDGNEGIAWAVTLKGSPQLIGHISFHKLIKEHYRAEVGYIMHPAYYGKGIMNEALKAVLDYGFNTMGLHSVEANVNPENIASINLLERNNFIREAYFKENYYWQDKFLDTAIYSLLAPDS